MRWLTHSYIRQDNKNYICPLTDGGKKKIPDVQVILVFMPCSGKVSEQRSEKDDRTASAPCIQAASRDLHPRYVSCYETMVRNTTRRAVAQQHPGGKFKTSLLLTYLPLVLLKTRTLHLPDLIWSSSVLSLIWWNLLNLKSFLWTPPAAIMRE